MYIINVIVFRGQYYLQFPRYGTENRLDFFLTHRVFTLQKKGRFQNCQTSFWPRAYRYILILNIYMSLKMI